MAKEAFKVFEEAFGYHPGWAVTVEYNIDKMSMRIVSVERWNEEEHYGKDYIIYIKEGRDEIDAYKEAKRLLEQPK
jgi:hypothetical protein